MSKIPYADQIKNKKLDEFEIFDVMTEDELRKIKDSGGGLMRGFDFKPVGNVAGKCKRCGKCCEYLFLHLVIPDLDEEHLVDWIKWIEFHGISVETKKSQLIAKVPLRCLNLDEEKLCNLPKEEKPIMCREGYGQSVLTCGYKDRG